MGRIKIKDLPKEVEMTDEEQRKVFGGALTLNQNRWTTSTLRIFRKPPTFIEWNDEEEHIFNTTQIKY